MFKSLAIILAVALVANANQDYKSNRMKLLTQTVSARLHGETIPSDQPQFKAVSRTKNLQATIPQGSQMQFQQQPQFVSQSFGSSMPPQFAAPQQPQQFAAPQQPQFAAPQQPQQFAPQFQAPSAPQRAASPMEQAQLQQQMQKQQQFQQQQNQINAQKAVQDQQVLQQQQQLIQQQQQQQAIAGQQQQPQPIVPQQPQQQPQFVVSPDASAISGAQAPISPLQQQQLMQQQQQQQMINSQQQSQIPQLQQQQAAQLQQQIQAQRIPQSQPIQQAQMPISQQFVPQQPQQFVPQQQMTQQPQFVPQQPFQQQMPVSQTGLAQTCSTAQPGDLVAHPSSPSSFIICYGFGEFTVMDCPEHLVFNAHTQRCDLTTDVPMGCASNPCMNNGRCTDLTLGQFRCDCPVGFAGIQCERVDACSANTCGGDGVCIALPAGSPVPNACMCNGGRSIGVTCASAEANPCIQPNSNLKLFSVNFNPSLFAHCEGARPNFMFCQAPLIFNAAKQSCDWPSRK